MDGIVVIVIAVLQIAVLRFLVVDYRNFGRGLASLEA